jgi:hypothetical protein
MRAQPILFTLVAAALATSSLHAQTSQATAKTSTKVEVKDGRDVKVSGCLVRHDGISGFALSNVLDRDAPLDDVILVGDTDKLADHVGQLVEIKGKLADGPTGKVHVDSKTTVDREHAPDSEARVKTDTKGDLNGFPVLGVKDLKTLRASCSL